MSTKRPCEQTRQELTYFPYSDCEGPVRKKRRKVTASNQDPVLGSSLNRVLQQFICPITKELLIDPVVAEDGKIYEKSAIEHLIGQNELIGSKLVPVVHVRNTIESIIKSDAIFDIKTRRKANKWLKKIANVQKIEQTKARAISGSCAEAMITLGYWHTHGMNGFKRDDLEAFSWFRKAADCGHVKTMVLVGWCLLRNSGSITGVPQNIPEALYYLTLAAQNGSDVGAYNIGRAYTNGFYGLKRNTKLGKYWLSKAVDGSCEVRHCDIDMITDAKRELEYLTK